MTKEQWNEAKFQRYLKEGRGQGELQNYKPWLTIQSYKSSGRSSRIFGWKTSRIHHLLSDNETRYFYLLEFYDHILDIREHYPILDMDVLGEMSDINMLKYRDKESGMPYVFTTTFLITLKDGTGSNKFVARSIRSAHELEKSSTLERMELLRRYFDKKGIDWGIVTQKDIPKNRAQAIEWVHSAKNLDSTEIHGISIESLTEVFLDKLQGKRSLRDITSAFDSQLNMEPGTGILLLRHLIANKVVRINMDAKIDLGMTADELILSILPWRSSDYGALNG